MWNICIRLFNLIMDLMPKEKISSQSSFLLGNFFIVLLIQDSKTKTKTKLHSSLLPSLIKTSDRFGKTCHLKYMFSAWWLPDPYRHFFFFFGGNYFKFIFNWRMIASQCCVGFCCIITWISRKYTYIPSLLNLPSSPPIPPLGRHRALSWAPCAIQQVPTSCLFYTW